MKNGIKTRQNIRIRSKRDILAKLIMQFPFTLISKDNLEVLLSLKFACFKQILLSIMIHFIFLLNDFVVCHIVLITSGQLLTFCFVEVSWRHINLERKLLKMKFRDKNKIIPFTLQPIEFRPEWDPQRTLMLRLLSKYSWMVYPYIEMIEIF